MSIDIKKLEDILKETYPLLPLEKKPGVYSIKDLAIDFNKEVERRLSYPKLPGITKDRQTVFTETIEALRIDSKGYLEKVLSNIHPSNRAFRDRIKNLLNE